MIRTVASVQSVQPATAAKAGSRVAIVESARGFAAVYVFFSHIVLISGISQSFRGASVFFQPFSFGHQAVLLFFFLSGFSIHYASRNRHLDSRRGRLEYAYLRFRRLYPLYLVAILTTILLLEVGGRLWMAGTGVGGEVLDWKRVWATAFFLADYPWPGHWFEVIPTNTPLWSLAYEVVYYALYPAFWWIFRRYGIGRAFAGTVLLSALFAGLNFAWQPNHVSNVLSLYWLWGAGALLAEWQNSGHRISSSQSGFYTIWLAVVMATVLFDRLPVPFVGDWLWGGVIFATMLSFLMNLSFASKASRYRGIVAALGVLVASMMVAQMLPFAGKRALICGLIAATLAAWWSGWPQRSSLPRACVSALRPFFTAGAYSYGLYVIHMPILCFMMQCFRKWPLPLPAVWLWSSPLLILPVARMLELHWQPNIAAQMDRLKSVWAAGQGSKTGKCMLP